MPIRALVTDELHGHDSFVIHFGFCLSTLAFAWRRWVTPLLTNRRGAQKCRVAELGSLSARAKMAIQIFVKLHINYFATNASFLRVIEKFANLYYYHTITWPCNSASLAD